MAVSGYEREQELVGELAREAGDWLDLLTCHAARRPIEKRP